MGTYDPYTPEILGQSWVPIREENLSFSPGVNVVEYGHSFTTTGTEAMGVMRMYINELPPLGDRGQTYMAAVYPQGTEALSGPIRRELIPAYAAAVSGGSVIGGVSAQESLLTSSLETGILFDTSQANVGVILSFAVNQYQNLVGKRILGVNLLTGGAGTDDIFGAGSQSASAVYLALGTNIVPSTPFAIMGRFGDDGVIARNKFGEVNQFWASSFGVPTPQSNKARMPWVYNGLRRLDSLSTRIWTILTTGTAVNSGTVAGHSVCFLFYAALEVLYCEEQRVAVGGVQFGTTFAAQSFGTSTIVQTNSLSIYDMAAYQADLTNGAVLTPASLPAGSYTMTLSAADVGANNDNQVETSANFGQHNALRQLYPMPLQPGVQVNIPFPMDDTAVGKVFIAEETDVLIQLTGQHDADNSPVLACHVYGRQAVAQVFGTVYAFQDIEGPATGSGSYPLVRYYARRFGETTVSLVFDCPALTGTTNPTASITPAQFDALPEIIDGWKEITLTLSTPLVLSSGSNQYRWRAVGEVAGNRWEVMGTYAPAIIGDPSALWTQVPLTDRLGPATYGVRSGSGASVNMDWMPAYTPPSVTPTSDPSTDAVLMFSKYPASVSGFSRSQQSQTLVGIGLNCGVAPEFIPTALAYNQLTWTPDPDTLAFGYTEIQRMDTIDTDWQSIMKATSPTVTGFRDYEARVGILTSYRIREVNIYGFEGQWSPTITGTIAAPGVTATSLTATDHVLIFTTNSIQSGASNLAYSPGWEGEVVTEDFNFPEAAGQVFQTMYDRDYVTAFRPLERGGTNFSRNLLVQAAAISPATLEDFTSLRDMAWVDVPYICVRDEAGNRWFSNVSVPSGRVQLYRSIYRAPITVVQVTNTPTPVDP